MPENNLILDVGIGEILRSNGSPYSLTEWARFTNQNIKHLRSLFTASKRLVKQKLHRKGYMNIVTDEEKTSEDFLKDKNIHSQIKEFEKDESIIESTAFYILQFIFFEY